MTTLLLNPTTWDLTLDASRNIAVADVPYARAQDVASAVRTFRGECYYDMTLGLPYFDQVLGHLPPMSLLQALVVEQAMTVEGVVQARCVITGFDNRVITGQVHVIDVDGVANDVAF